MKLGLGKNQNKYAKVSSQTQGNFSIEDEEDDDVEIAFTPNSNEAELTAQDTRFEEPSFNINPSRFFCDLWSTLTFSWMQPLLQKGNERPLTNEDLFNLPVTDGAEGVYRKFRKYWTQQLQTTNPSLTHCFVNAFGKPFLAAGLLKFIHDSTIFVGPQLLNAIIKFLNDGDEPIETGLLYVLGLFVANVIMSLCLRQYFWWCYRVGMNLRSSVVTAVYGKSLVVSAGAMSKKTTGEISNLMSVDAFRLQDLTPYLHALWYSLYQIVVALFFLYRQMGISCLSGMAVIILTIPVTSQVSRYLKGLQSRLSKIRDDRIKITNEVLSGMKVIKLQAWELQFQKRIQNVRSLELTTYRKYAIAQALSGALYTSIPLMVSIVTFATYIALGNQLDVATALTSLALFDLLRFPLFMLPQVINNVVEAKVSVDRVQGFLLQPERESVSSFPLRHPGSLMMDRATLVWESGVKKRKTDDILKIEKKTFLQKLYSFFLAIYYFVCCKTPAQPSAESGIALNPLNRANSSTSVSSVASNTSGKNENLSGKNMGFSDELLSPDEFLNIVQDSQLKEAEKTISELENEVLSLRQQLSKNGKNDESDKYALAPSSDVIVDLEEEEFLHGKSGKMSEKVEGSGKKDTRVLTLSRLTLDAKKGQLVCIVGQVGSGKSSVLSGLLGDMRLCAGSLAIYGKIAYAGQIPFIQNSTLRDNITYGSEFFEQKYLQTLQECALLPDIKVLPAGHDTEIGERGINLSGGQKARVGLARAVYADADIYLLDDPLSAVDAHVGQELFEGCILELKKRGKCVVLVTNALQFLKNSDKIILLKDGRIVEKGTYSDLIQLKGNFSEMISTMNETSSGKLTLSTGPSSENLTTQISETENTTKSVETEKPKKEETKEGLNQKSEKPKGTLMTVEEREMGDVDRKVYLKWITAAGGISVGVLVVLFFYIGEMVAVLSSWWLSFWSEHRHTGNAWYYLGIYALINLGVVVFSLSREVYMRLKALNAGRVLFIELLAAVLFAPMSFFDTTPLGRVINRFSKDVYTVDEKLPQTFRGYLGTMAKVTTTILYIVVITPLFLVALIPIIGFYVMAQRYYIKTSRELTRLESTSRSPIYALFSETLDGLSTIRAYKAEERLTQKNNKILDTNVKSYFLNFSANCWLAVRLEFAGALIVTFAALFAVLASNRYGSAEDSSPLDPDATTNNDDQERQAFAGLAGLSISFALTVTQSLNWTVRMASNMESEMVSVERIKTYCAMDQEAEHEKDNDPLTEDTFRTKTNRNNNKNQIWPTEGAILFNNVTMRYRPSLPLVLKGLSLKIEPREKVGIVGRTGAGKSSLLTALLRLVELEGGAIMIDGVDTSKIGLNTLRSVMAVIPQDPVLFSGTIRSNLDPFDKYPDEVIWEGLQRTLLSNSITSLDDTVTENGSNFSVGQRQLLCIARALLAKAKIIIMDEATAAVDVETDAIIQQTIRTEFKHATCLTVAHRLNTILDSDKVLVMEQGTAAEFDSPKQLLANENSMFYALVSDWENAH